MTTPLRAKAEALAEADCSESSAQRGAAEYANKQLAYLRGVRIRTPWAAKAALESSHE